jgi:homoserine O-succinyltransferase/O-acetyltransferase
MTVLLDTLPSSTEGALRGRNCITVGLVNNMPDAALTSTERQFTGLMRAASSRVVVRLLLFSIPEIPRGEEAQQEIGERYRNISELWNSRVDGLIVTGTEPRAKNLKDEPYWNTLGQIVDWAYDNTTAAIWSCLGAHAAVLHMNGIDRQPAAEKVHGVFDCEAAYLHPMTVGTARGFRVPHSRYNGLSEQDLVEGGYRVLTRSPVGVDMFAKQEKSFHLFLQGHPEYEASTLLREYRRDVCRYLKRERETYPALPQNYLGEAATTRAASFREQALVDRQPDLMSRFPMEQLAAGLEAPWASCAIGIYEKWFEYVAARKSEERPLTTQRRRAWRDWPDDGVVAATVRSTRERL